MKEHFIDCRGLKIHVVEWGESGKRTILLHHGFLDHARSWDRVAAILAKEYRVLALDARGHGDSEWLRGGGYYFFQDYVFDVADVVDTLIGDTVILVGHSMGGMVCSLFAGTFPDRVSALVSVEGAGSANCDPSVAPERMLKWISGVRQAMSKTDNVMSGVEEAARRLRHYNPRLSEEFSLHLARYGTKRNDSGEGLVWKFDPVHRTRSPQPFYLEQARSFWKNVSAPALIVRGELTRAHWDSLENRECFPDTRSVTIPDAGHMIHYDQPEQLATTTLSFL